MTTDRERSHLINMGWVLGIALLLVGGIAIKATASDDAPTELTPEAALEEVTGNWFIMSAEQQLTLCEYYLREGQVLGYEPGDVMSEALNSLLAERCS